MKRLLLSILILHSSFCYVVAQIQGALQSYNDGKQNEERRQQYEPQGNAFFCENGMNRYTRALYGSHSDWRLETSDRPIFAVVKKNHHRNIRFVVNGVPLDSAKTCRAWYRNGIRHYAVNDQRWQWGLSVMVVALPDEEGAVFCFSKNAPCTDMEAIEERLSVKVLTAPIARPKLQRNGDIGVDPPGVFEPSPDGEVKVDTAIMGEDGSMAYVVVKLDQVEAMSYREADGLLNSSVAYYKELTSRVQFTTPNPYINTLGGALVLAADGDWDGKTWLHGCIGWRMPLAGWRAAYAGDVLGWNDRAISHFDAYAKSQVTQVEPTIPHPTQDEKMNMARAEKKWGTQMYSNGYICRNPERNDQMHHYDMNLNYMDELLWHFQYDADTAYMRKMWPVIKSHLDWEKRNYDPDGDHLYDAYCCIWASDALFYSGGAVTHSSAYNYRGNKLAARIAEIIGEDAKPYRDEAEAILKAMNERLWIAAPDSSQGGGHWAEYQDALGLKRVHESPAVWSIYTPIDCGACSPEQAWQATDWVSRNIPHIPVSGREFRDSSLFALHSSLATIATSNWMPYSWSINNVANAEVWHTALAFFEAGRSEEGYSLMMANILDNMYLGQSPANFGQLSFYDAARGECYRDFGDCIGTASRTLIQGFFGIIPQALDGKCLIQPGFPHEWDSVEVRTPYLQYKFTRKNGKDRYEITQHFRRPLTIVVSQNMGNGTWRYTTGISEEHQVIEVPSLDRPNGELERFKPGVCTEQTDLMPQATTALGLDEPDLSKPFRQQDIARYFNAEVNDIFKNEYLSPRPQTTTLQIPLQGVGEWCHPQYTPTINDSVFRTLIQKNQFDVAGVPFRTPHEGRNIVYTSLWDNYSDSITIPLKGKASSIYLLLAGSTNHMQSRIENGLVIATYKDGTSDTLRLRNPENWCPIEQDYFVDGKAFRAAPLRPYRVCLGTGTVSRDLGTDLNIKGVYGREIPGGAAQMLRMPADARKTLKSLTIRTLSNDVVIGLMGVTMQ